MNPSVLTPALPETVLEVSDLQVQFETIDGIAPVLDGLSYTLKSGETLAIVGESGCGKTIGALSLLRLAPSPPARITGGSIRLSGRDILTLTEDEMRGIRGNDIAMIFQEPMTALNPVLTIGHQIVEPLMLHKRLNRSAAWERAVELLRLVEIPEPERRASEYPHQLSGGMRQRAMIAMALACGPKILVADEPTTALDVTIQAQILKLMADLKHRVGTAILLITHDLAVVAQTADRVVVMYAGRVVEDASVYELFENPRHPYTRGLLASIPKLSIDDERQKLEGIPGSVPPVGGRPSGCTFAPRCTLARDECRQSVPVLETVSPTHKVACWAVIDATSKQEKEQAIV
ncbi:ABC transporter ATP-binding protein [Microvirga sp. ACRRW]|uniref:ABC transporter ATP-binding protein n=1 Tax=Microvirga sp. ACRRW TaxID=2918205 RepID=UPI001EF65AC6|nr:ABC transporter ATP-binding protein [Microvirga sp. ACRRW]MCG7393410.1 ABC transporter ATP-binding protein [Microvirga sp. ACRRW]